MSRMTKFVGVGSAAAVIGSTAAIGMAPPAGANHWIFSASCISSAGGARFRVTFGLHGHEDRSGGPPSEVLLSSVDYQFELLDNPNGREIGPSTNINIIAPVSRTSPDSMGDGGNWDFTNFSDPSNTLITVQGIPDVRGVPDDPCSVNINVALK